MTAPHARRVERTRRSKPGPHVQDLASCRTCFVFHTPQRTKQKSSRTNALLPRRDLAPKQICLENKACPRRPHFPNSVVTLCLLDRTPVLLRSGCFNTNETASVRVYSDEPPLNWTSHSRGNPARRASTTVFQLREVSKTSGSYPQLMRLRLANLLSPPRDISFIALLFAADLMPRVRAHAFLQKLNDRRAE